MAGRATCSAAEKAEVSGAARWAGRGGGAVAVEVGRRLPAQGMAHLTLDQGLSDHLRLLTQTRRQTASECRRRRGRPLHPPSQSRTVPAAAGHREPETATAETDGKGGGQSAAAVHQLSFLNAKAQGLLL